jgi:hypothetical protein
MAEITKKDFLDVYHSYNNLLCEISSAIIAAAMVEVKEVDSAVLLEITSRHADELKELTKHITGE